MAERIIKLPDVGEGIAEAELVEWHVKVGDIVREDDLLAAVMTDKATVEIPAPIDGEVLWIGAEIGDTVAIGSAIVRLKIAGDANAVDEPEPAAEEAPAEKPAAATPPAKPKAAESKTGEPKAAEPAADAPPRALLTPAPRKAPTPAPAASPVPRRAVGEKPIASPAIRLKAREAGIDLRQLQGSGPGGRMRTSTPSCCAVPKPDTRRGWPRRRASPTSRSSASGARSPRRWRCRSRASRTSPSSRRSTSPRSKICARR
jgi:2-oxoisovalerate dehydrogenase E2 component (dihydrolipoyl transacylase)